jgi:hypothetical protein
MSITLSQLKIAGKCKMGVCLLNRLQAKRWHQKAEFFLVTSPDTMKLAREKKRSVLAFTERLQFCAKDRSLHAENRLAYAKGMAFFKTGSWKKYGSQKAEFFSLHHQTHFWPEKKLQDAGVNRKLAIISLLNFFRLKQTPVGFMVLEAFYILFGHY